MKKENTNKMKKRPSWMPVSDTESSSEDEMTQKVLNYWKTEKTFTLAKFNAWKTLMWNHVFTDAGDTRPIRYKVNTGTDNNAGNSGTNNNTGNTATDNNAGNTVTDNNSGNTVTDNNSGNTVTDNNSGNTGTYNNDTPSNAASQSCKTKEAPIENTPNAQTVSNIEPSQSNNSSQNNEGTSITSPNISVVQGTSEQRVVPSTSRIAEPFPFRGAGREETMRALDRLIVRNKKSGQIRVKLPYFKPFLKKKLYKK